MAALDLADLLRTASRPLSRADALRQGLLVDCTQAAAWMGFTTPAAMTAAAWEETVGHHTLASTLQERADAGVRLRSVWQLAAHACQIYKAQGIVLPSIAFRVRSAAGARFVRCRLAAGMEHGQPFVTLSLEGE
jgi:hypothetical protein